MGPGSGRGPSSGSGSGPGLGSAPDRATHLIAARLGDALLELSARDLGPARARRQEVRGGKRKRRPNSVVLSASATLPEPNRPASRRLTSARALRRSAERRLTLGRAVVARRRRAQPRCSGQAAHRASFPIAFATDSMGANASCLASTTVSPTHAVVAPRPLGRPRGLLFHLCSASKRSAAKYVCLSVLWPWLGGRTESPRWSACADHGSPHPSLPCTVCAGATKSRSQSRCEPSAVSDGDR